MIDFHSHILPGMDDGATSCEVSLEMLKKSRSSGVDAVIATSHCYPHSNNSLLRFLDRREAAYESLCEAIEKDGGEYPKIIKGCELNMFIDIAKLPDVGRMCISGTDYIMVEMPSDPWKEWMTEAVYNLTVLGLKPVMAHIDRFLNQKRDALLALFELDVLYQVNTSAFLTRRMEKQMRTLLEEGHAHFLGTDMHNMQTRTPNMAEAKKAMNENFGGECWGYFEENALAALKNQPPVSDFFTPEPKKSFLLKLFEKK